MNRKIFYFFLGIALLTSAKLVQAQPSWQDQVSELVSQNLPAAETGIIVMDAKSGKVLYKANAHKAFTPASTVKLFSSTAALAYLGADHQFNTTVRLNPKQLRNGILKGNLYFRFSGDPTLKEKALLKLIKQVKHYGIHKITGNIILDNKRFEKPNYAPGWTYDSLHWAFSAPITSIILNQNHVNLKFKPNKTVGKSVAIIPGKRMRYMNLQHEISTVTYDKAMHHCSLLLKVGHDNTIQLGGCWPDTSAGWRSFAIQNPALYASKVIAHYMKEQGVTYSGKILTGYIGKGTKVIARHQSKPLSDLLITMLKDSDNIYAESLTKTMGYYHSGRGSFLEGVNTIKTIDGKLADINFDKTVLHDGSGQSRYDLLTPHQVAKLLYSIYNNKKLKKTMMHALPVSGTDGTLRYRLTSDQMQGKVIAKTGSMTGVSALSGYVTTHSGHHLIFSIMMNHFLGKIKEESFPI